LQAVDSVKPSSRYLKDDMDFNKYVNIELLDYKDNTKSQYVNGCVLMKNLADRRMPHELDNPKILLLQGSLGFMREYEDQSMYSPQ
jgi:chaperonin GroEL (HSP60 family)